MSGKTLPSNVDDPRFTSAEQRWDVDWGDPDASGFFLWSLIEALLEALPRVVEGVPHR